MFSDPVLSYRRIEKELGRLQKFSKYVDLKIPTNLTIPLAKYKPVNILKILAIEEHFDCIAVGDIAYNYLLR